MELLGPVPSPCLVVGHSSALRKLPPATISRLTAGGMGTSPGRPNLSADLETVRGGGVAGPYRQLAVEARKNKSPSRVWRGCPALATDGGTAKGVAVASFRRSRGPRQVPVRVLE